MSDNYLKQQASAAAAAKMITVFDTDAADVAASIFSATIVGVFISYYYFIQQYDFF